MWKCNINLDIFKYIKFIIYSEIILSKNIIMEENFYKVGY